MPSSGRSSGVPRNFLFTPTFPAAGTAIAIRTIQSGKLMNGISQKSTGGDGDIWDTARFLDKRDPSLQLDTEDGNATIGISPEMLGTITYDVYDHRNGVAVGGGGYGVTISNAYLDSDEIDHKYREFAKHPVAFKFLSTDGVTNPVTITLK